MSGSKSQSPKLLDRVRQTCRRRQYSYHTEKAYVRWTERFVRFHDTTHPRHLDEDDIRAFLNHLASDRNVAASTQNQALNALVFLYEQVLGEDLDDIGPLDRADRPQRLPTVLSRGEVQRLFAALSSGPNRLIAHLLYGSGLRLSESRRPSGCGSRSSASRMDAFTCGTERGGRTGRPCSPSASTPRSGATCKRERPSTKRTVPRAWAGSTCPTRSRKNTRTPRPSGGGSTSFRPRRSRKIRGAGPSAATTAPTRRCSGPSRRPPTRRRSRSAPPATPFVTPLLRFAP